MWVETGQKGALQHREGSACTDVLAVRASATSRTWSLRRGFNLQALNMDWMQELAIGVVMSNMHGTTNWAEGFRPSQDDLLLILSRLSTLVGEHAATAQKEKEAGLLAAPATKTDNKRMSWQNLLEAKESNGMPDSSMMEITRAHERLRQWRRKRKLHQFSLD